MAIEPGTFHELPGGKIAQVFSARAGAGHVAYRLDDGVDIRKATDAETALWIPRPDLSDFPDARDPILPGTFRKTFGLARMSEIPAALGLLAGVPGPRGHDALVLSIEEHGLGGRLRRMVMDNFAADPVNAISTAHLSAAAGMVADADAGGDALHADTMLKVTALPGGGYAVDHLVSIPAGVSPGIETVRVGGADLLPQGIASGLDAPKATMLAAFVLAQADRTLGDTREAVADGSVPHDVASFSEVHDHIDANELPAGQLGVFEPHLFVGRGVGDLEEAWCGVLNCAMSGTDAAIRRGGLAAWVPAPVP